jgi:hypothetical protein
MLVTVGSIANATVKIDESGPPITFLGEALEPPKDEKASIDITLCTGNIEPDGTFLRFAFAIQMTYVFPIMEINFSPFILPNFKIEYDYLAIGLSQVDPGFIGA